MADTTQIDKLSLSTEQQELDQLIGCLEEKYNMPDEGWWTSVDTAFHHLQTLLERRPNEVHDEDNDPESISAQAARADALPLVSLLPSGSHALRLTATNEDLQCVAFGTISAEIYIDIFWEAVSKVQDDGGKFVVYKIESGAFWFNLGGHNFQLLYLRCEDLVRNCPDILNVSDETLQESDIHTQRIVEGIKRDTKGQASNSKRDQKVSYYYSRALKIARGRYTPNHSLTSSRTLNFQELIKTMDPAQPLDLKVLQVEEAKSVHSQLDMPFYIQVDLIYWGGSELACGKWLAMIERRLRKLKERLETTIPRPDEVCLYPHRLLNIRQESRDSGDGYWAGSYVLGIRRNAESKTDERVVNVWNLQVVADAVIPKEDCSIKVVYTTASEFNDKNLIMCRRNWPRPELPLDREKSHMVKQDEWFDYPKKAPKHQKASEQASNEEAASKESSKGLRTARAVLSRLKHDSSFKIDEFKVGYEDRHCDVIQEKSVASWVRETTDDLFIPEHRIVWFKRCPANGEEVIVWDRASRIDRIFGE